MMKQPKKLDQEDHPIYLIIHSWTTRGSASGFKAQTRMAFLSYVMTCVACRHPSSSSSPSVTKWAGRMSQHGFTQDHQNFNVLLTADCLTNVSDMTSLAASSRLPLEKNTGYRCQNRASGPHVVLADYDCEFESQLSREFPSGLAVPSLDDVCFLIPPW